MSIHFRFKSSKEYETIPIEGNASFASVGELKRAISIMKCIPLGTSFDLILTNAQSGEGKYA